MSEYVLQAIAQSNDPAVIADIGERLVVKIMEDKGLMKNGEIVSNKKKTLEKDTWILLHAACQHIKVLDNRALASALKTESQEQLETRLKALVETSFIPKKVEQIDAIRSALTKRFPIPEAAAETAETSEASDAKGDDATKRRRLTINPKVYYERLIEDM